MRVVDVEDDDAEFYDGAGRSISNKPGRRPNANNIPTSRIREEIVKKMLHICM